MANGCSGYLGKEGSRGVITEVGRDKSSCKILARWSSIITVKEDRFYIYVEGMCQ